MLVLVERRERGNALRVWGRRNENGKAFDLPVRNQSIYRYYVCTLDKRDIHVLARAILSSSISYSSYYCLL